MSVWRGVLLAAMASLPACASIDRAFETAPRSTRAASAPPVAAPESPQERSATRVRPTVTEPAPRTTTPLDPAQLVGLNPAQLESFLGRPSSVREEPPATVWAYRAGPCSLEVFFFMSVETKAMKALAYDLKPPQRSAAARNDCFDSIVAETRDRR
jgi:hypothetical protein